MIKISDKNKKKLSLIGIMLSCVAPIIAAHLYFHYGNPKGATINKGTLLNPVLDISKLELVTNYANQNIDKFKAKKWHIIYNNSLNYCDNTCTNIIYQLQQVVVSLGKNTDRVQRVVIIKPDSSWDEIFTQYPHLSPVTTTNSNINNYLKPNNIYISDPNGNIILAYDLADAHYNSNIVADLKKLLNISKIG